MANPTTNLGITLPVPGAESSRGTWGEIINDAIQDLDTAIVAKTGGTFTGAVTIPSPVINTGVSGSAILDSDTMSGASATTLSSSESIKAYVDAQVTASDLDFQGDSGGALSIDLDSEVLDIAGGTGIDTTGSGNEVSVAIDSTVPTLTGSQTLTNKTLTAPALGTPASGVATNLTGTASGLTAGNVTTNANLTGHITSSGNASTLGAFTVAQLSSALSDATISGNNTGDLTNGIANTNNVVVDSASVADDDYAKFTSSGLEGRSATEAKTDLSLNNVENTALSTWAGTSNITTVGTVGAGTWEGTTVAVDQGGTGVTSKTGTGNVVLSNSPTLVTPALGTPASGVLTSCTGTASGLTAGSVTTNANLTGDVTSSGNATSIASDVIVNADVKSDAAIAISKTALIGGTGLTLSTNTLNVDAAQTHITSVGTIGTGTWQGTAVAQAYVADQAINEAKMQVSNAPTNGYALIARSGNTGGMTWEDLGTSFDTAGTGVAMAIALG